MPHTRSWPRAILHVDGDSFFAGCEIAKNPKLRGKPVVVGRDRGIAVAMSTEAKRRGVTRGLPLHLIRRVCPEAVILDSDHESYSLYSRRMYEIVRRFTPEVEEYSIDECFADLTGLRRPLSMSYADIAREIKSELQTELGLTFSVGLSVNKVLAKLASNQNKPDGFTVISGRDCEEYLQKVPVENIWGVGPNTAALLKKHRIETALKFAETPAPLIYKWLAKPYQEIYRELKGEFVLPLSAGEKRDQVSISKTRTFTPPSTDRDFIYSQLSKNIENACAKLRRHKLFAKSFTFYLKTQKFRYQGLEVALPWPISTPAEILEAITSRFDEVFAQNTAYRATGITLTRLSREEMPTLGLFGEAMRREQAGLIYRRIDELDRRFGRHTVFLGSSLRAVAKSTKENAENNEGNFLYRENKKRRLGLLSLGKVN